MDPVSDEHPTGGQDTLLSLAQITQRFGVSRTTLHTLRSQGVFPDPETVPGSTRLRWRESAVAAYFEANPLRQGARTDLRGKSPGGDTEPPAAE
jgi:predicted DNA-binding transcriptional regulator AlpA